ncbi:hypothetical protein [Bosea sp. R86505]|uniref:hypothetical protein n=1 Tax=Bosea sp. R86505 TaxID=3101710 RepID=UPI00366CFD91
MAKPIDTQNVSIDKKASAAALAAILAAEPPWLNLDTVRRQQGRAIARAYSSGWQPRDFVEEYVKARAGACTSEERANAEAVYTRLKTECDSGALKASRPRAKAGDKSGGGPNDHHADDEGDEGKGVAVEENASADAVWEAGAAWVGSSEQPDRRTSASPLPEGMDVVQMDVSLDDFDKVMASHAGQMGSRLDQAEK